MTLKLKISFIYIFLLFIFCYGSSQSFAATNLDEEIFFFINKDLNSPYLDQPMLFITHLGDSVTQCLTISTFYLAGEKETSYLLTSALAKTWWTTQLLKNTIQRPRPGMTSDEIRFINDYVIKDNKSFPSGHTAGAFAVATVLSHQYPQYKPYFYTTATLIGISRIYVGVHYPGDVLAGALLGYFIGTNTIKNKNLIIKGNVIEYSIRF